MRGAVGGVAPSDPLTPPVSSTRTWRRGRMRGAVGGVAPCNLLTPPVSSTRTWRRGRMRGAVGGVAPCDLLTPPSPPRGRGGEGEEMAVRGRAPCDPSPRPSPPRRRGGEGERDGGSGACAFRSPHPAGLLHADVEERENEGCGRGSGPSDFLTPPVSSTRTWRRGRMRGAVGGVALPISSPRRSPPRGRGGEGERDGGSGACAFRSPLPRSAGGEG